ncbi:HNH endonuclease [Deinococcus sp. QL22]|uniref:HNH endonuclease n=1 Tax=Deinococcus sp. QL22 TaxID=2939437 RepID=UPI002017DBBB|nr:HNH endonuclease [Deinococcus sp. QL22]UQN06511.1 HNH endonuclease [Deinococcus sp. QL22]
MSVLPFPPGDFPCVLLTIRVTDNAYADSDDAYVYPARYRAALAPLEAGQPMLALIYEPRHGGGRMAYVAWALLTTPPESIGKGRGGQQEWRVRYDGGLIPLPRPVSQEVSGHVFETLLRGVPRELRGPAQRGMSVRALAWDDFCAVLAASGLVPVLTEREAPEDRLMRQRVAVERLVRERGFRLRVLSAYGWRCAVTGWSAPPDLSHALLDAAHLVSVARGGSDGVRNGLALTPTVHRLFDAGLVNFTFQDGSWRLQRHRSLDDLRLEGAGGRLELVHGQPLILPGDRRLWPEIKAAGPPG